jgi:hypothetical protein
VCMFVVGLLGFNLLSLGTKCELYVNKVSSFICNAVVI